MRFSRILILFVVLTVVSAPARAETNVDQIADAWLEGFAAFDPFEARLWGVATPSGDLMGDNRITARIAWIDQQRIWLAALSPIDPDSLDLRERTLLINLRGKLEAAIALQACRPELWPLNHVAGWHLNLINSLGIAGETAGENLDPDQLRLWVDDLLDYLVVEEENLRAGLAAGYSTPRGIALQVAAQMDALAEANGALETASDFLPDELADIWRDLVQTRLNPGFAAHTRFIREEYAPLARTERSLSSLPNGEACYAASILRHTGIRMTDTQLLSLSADMTRRAEQHLTRLGEELWGLSAPAEIRAQLEATSDTALEGEDAVIAAAQADSDRLIAASRPYFPDLPAHRVRMEVYPQTQRAAMVASYRPDFEAGYAGIYFLNPEDPRMSARRSSESVTSHEVAPGHHMQAMVGLDSGALGANPAHQILTVGMNNAFVEGWAQYAEIFAAEAGLLSNPEIGLRFWSEFGGSIPIEVNFNAGTASEPDTARRLLERRGAPTDDLSPADPVLDWLAMMPAQVISYDLGADFIYLLRDRARAELGEAFDYPTFHRLILEEGSVPLWRLEDKVNTWIADAG